MAWRRIGDEPLFEPMLASFLAHIYLRVTRPRLVNSSTLDQMTAILADDILKCIFLNDNVWILIKTSLNFVPDVPINNIPALVQIMAWRRPGDKTLTEQILVRLPTFIYVTPPRLVNKSVARHGISIANALSHRCVYNTEREREREREREKREEWGERGEREES